STPGIECNGIIVRCPHQHSRAGNSHRSAEAVIPCGIGVGEGNHGHTASETVANVIEINSPAIGASEVTEGRSNRHSRAGDRHRVTKVVVQRWIGVAYGSEENGYRRGEQSGEIIHINASRAVVTRRADHHLAAGDCDGVAKEVFESWV